MNNKYNKDLVHNSKKLRRNMTKEEKHLWYDFLKNIPYNVNRQKVIGKYIVDFYCAELNVVIEVDGSQHYEESGTIGDIERDKYLNSVGLNVLRYSNLDINRSFNDVCADIWNYIVYNTKSNGEFEPSP